MFTRIIRRRSYVAQRTAILKHILQNSSTGKLGAYVLDVYGVNCQTPPPSHLDTTWIFQVLTAVLMKSSYPVVYNTVQSVESQPTFRRNTSTPSSVCCLQLAFTIVSCSDCYSTLKMEATTSTETSVDFQRTTRRYTPEDVSNSSIRHKHKKK
jgi:hypothetical protein